jgi:hypothetical protein
LAGLAVVCIAAVLLWWTLRAEEWRGFVYPDRFALTIHQQVGAYASLDQCRSAAQAVIRALPDPSRANYECGLNCRPQKRTDAPLICERTER